MHGSDADDAARIGFWKPYNWRRGFCDSVWRRIRNICNLLRLAPSCSVWTLICEPDFLLHQYVSLAFWRLHDSMTAIILDCVEL